MEHPLITLIDMNGHYVNPWSIHSIAPDGNGSIVYMTDKRMLLPDTPTVDLIQALTKAGVAEVVKLK